MSDEPPEPAAPPRRPGGRETLSVRVRPEVGQRLRTFVRDKAGHPHHLTMASFIEDAVDARIDDMSRPRNLLKKLPGGNVAVDADDEDAPAPQLGLRVLLLPGPAKALVFVTSDVRLLEWECPQELPFDTALVNNANRLASRLGMPSIEHHVWLKLAREIMFSVRPTLQVLQITVGPSGFTTCHL